MIRGIIFDCFGVLYQGSIEHLYELTPPQNRRALMDLSKSSDYGYISYEEYMQQVAALTGKATVEIEHIVSADHIRNDAMVAYVRSLGGKYKRALLSNVGRHLIDRLFTTEELAELFDAVVLSSEVGMIKPQPEIYELAAARLELAPQACLMIDDMAANIEGAQAVGMDGVIFTTTQEAIAAINLVRVGQKQPEI
jgi:HAD superfamily hydrolase (TIGR01493 family)